MALPREKKVIVYWKHRTTWRLDKFTFDFGPNAFSREQYQAFEVHPLFLRQVQSGKAVVEDPEYPAPPSDVPAPVSEPEQAEPTKVATEGGEVDAGEATGKKKGRRKDTEEKPS